MQNTQPLGPLRAVTQLLDRAHHLVFKRTLPLLLQARSHLRLLSVLATPSVAELIARHPAMRYKYLRSNYLMGSLSVADSLQTMIHHYRSLGDKVLPCFFARIFDDRPAIWEHAINDHQFKIRLAFPRHLGNGKAVFDHEGDLSVIFEMDQVPLYVLSMTLVPHHVATRSWGINSQTGVMFVGRVQGVRDRVEEMRTATKALKDIAPPRILLCAVEALATTLGADIIAGVSNAEQLERRRQGDKHDTFFDYDAFWQQVGAEPATSGVFCAPAQLPEKPIEKIQQKHRSRALSKRHFRKTVMESVTSNLIRDFLVATSH
ncbi:DUF535 family protein [Duganella sacchari]|nr:DUF535 family protein [Duganella sacchari]